MKKISLKNYFDESSKVIKDLSNEKNEIEKIVQIIKNCIKNNKKIIVAGNGGSSSDADHFVGELVCTYKKKSRKSIFATSLSSNSAILTAWSNDFDFSTVYERQLSSIGKRGDLLILLSTSGANIKDNQSINLIKAAHIAKKLGIKVVSIVGNKGGDLKKISNLTLIINSNQTSHIQEAQISVLHCICEYLD